MKFTVSLIVLALLIVGVFSLVFIKANEKYFSGVNKTNGQNISVNKTSDKKSLTLLDSKSCIDSDSNSEFQDGKNVDVAGKTCIGGNCKMDNCTSQRNINEYYCNGEKIGVTNIKCIPGSFCKQIFNGSSYCTASVQNLTLKADKSKISYTSDKKKTILFSSNVKMEPFNPLPFTVYLRINSESAGKYKSYSEKQMNLNKSSGMYYASFAIWSFETYGEPITNITAEAIAKTDSVVVAKSKSVNIVLTK